MSTLSFLHSQLFVEPQLPQCDFAGQTIIVTGANRGLGLEAARHLINLNAGTVILAVRSLQKGEEAAKLLNESASRHGIAKAYELDMSSSKSVISFAKAMQSLPRIDAAILNAGIYTQDFKLIDDFQPVDISINRILLQVSNPHEVFLCSNSVIRCLLRSTNGHLLWRYPC